MKKLYDLKKASRTVLLVLLLGAVGIAKGYAQDFTEGGLNYTINDDGVSVTVSGEYGMWYEPLVIPESVEHNGVSYAVTAIGDHAFDWNSGCSLWGELIIPNSVITIGESAFDYCSTLTGLTIGNSVVEIGNSAFNSCEGLEGDLVIPNSVTTIGSSAFQWCQGFTGSLTLGNSVATIGDWAFWYCGFTGELVIPNSVSTIGAGAFMDCSGFTGSWSIPNTVDVIGQSAFAWCSGFTGDLVIPNSVVAIDDYAFIGCSGFTGLTIGNSVTTIGNEAFEMCYGLSGTLVIPNSVTTIGDYAFSSCDGFTGTLTIPASVNAIGANAFYGCNGLEQVMVDPENSVYDSRNNCNGIIETATNTLITGCKHTVIPNTVVSIGDYAFGGCDMISINIPNSVTKLGYGVFNWCPNLISITIPSSVTTIDGPQFSGCYNLVQVTVEAENPVYDSRDNCNAIVKSGSNELISGCKNSVIPNTVTIIGYGAFVSCNITSIVIPMSVTKIDHDAFCYSELEGDLVIPNSVVSIEPRAFYGCWNLNGTLVLGNSLNYIGQSAFAECYNLQHVVALASNPPTLFSYESLGYYGMDQLIVCCGSKEAYEASEWVNCFNTILEDCDQYAISVENTTGGTVSTSVNTAVLGEEVLISLVVDPGYELNSIMVCKADDETMTVPCYNNSFVMPNFDVVVKPSFGFTSVNDNTDFTVSIYPNPTNGMVSIEAEGLRRVSIFNTLGQQVYAGLADGDVVRCDLSNHEAGIYLIRMETTTGIVTKRVVVTK